MQARLKHCSTKAVLNISNVSAPFLPSFTQHLMHTCCSCSPKIPHGTNNNKVQIHDSSTEAHKGLSGALVPSLVPGREEVLGHHPANGCPEVYPQPSKKITLGTCWSHHVCRRIYSQHNTQIICSCQNENETNMTTKFTIKRDKFKQLLFFDNHKLVKKNDVLNLKVTFNDITLKNHTHNKIIRLLKVLQK